MKIQMIDLVSQYKAHKKEIDNAVSRVLSSGQYILGKEVSAFEEEFAEFIGGKHAVAVGNGTDAIKIALESFGIGSGDEVITVSHTAVATASAISQTGATPVFVDIEDKYFTIDPGKIEEKVTANTKAIIPVHIYGQAADMDSITAIASKHKLRIIEDCSQAHGAEYMGKTLGTLGDAAAFSFYPTKNLGAAGDGGIIITNEREIDKEARIRRQYGWDENRISKVSGHNSRFDDIQAAILRVKLSYLIEDNNYRINCAKRYSSALAETSLKLPATRDNCSHVFHLYVIQHNDRDKLMSHMSAAGIHTAIHYPVPVHTQKAFSSLPENCISNLDVSESTAKSVLSLPLYPGIPDSDIDTVINTISEGLK